MTTLVARPPRHFNPSPRFGLRPHACRECGIELEREDNPIVDLGGGAFAKFGLCALCLQRELDDRAYYDEMFDLDPRVIADFGSVE